MCPAVIFENIFQKEAASDSDERSEERPAAEGGGSEALFLKNIFKNYASPSEGEG